MQFITISDPYDLGRVTPPLGFASSAWLTEKLIAYFKSHMDYHSASQYKMPKINLQHLNKRCLEYVHNVSVGGTGFLFPD